MTVPDEKAPETATEASMGTVIDDLGREREEGDSGQQALDEARAVAEQAREQQLRAVAELENFRKRALKDVEQARKYAVERFAGELVSVKDSLEMALAAEPGGSGAGSPVLAGVEATLKLLAAAFAKAGIAEIVPTGEVFNPELHEAMAAQPSADHVPNSVLRVVQKGYRLNGRLLRPARVIVSRAP